MSPSHAIAIEGLDHVVVRASDVARMTAFYCDVLNCRVERQSDDLGLIQLRAGASLIDIVDANGRLGRQGGGPPDPEARNMDHFCDRVRPWDAEAIVDHLKRHGVEFGDVVSRYGALGSGPSLYVRDPEGNTIELKGPPRT